MSAMVCTVCSEDITDRAMKAGERLYHEHHFTCSVCQMSLADPGVITYTKHDKLYCQDDYMRQFVPVCAKCDQYITQECVKAMDKNWHPECFQCVGCSVQFSGSLTYRESGGAAFCDECYAEKILPKCFGCQRPITDRALKALDVQWHVKCFVCEECKTTFENSKNFYSVDGKPQCAECAGVAE